MAWKVELSPAADKYLSKLDPQPARRILKSCQRDLPSSKIRGALDRPCKGRDSANCGNTASAITA